MRQHQFDYAFAFMLIELGIFVSSTTWHSIGCDNRVNKIDTNAETGLSRVHFHLRMLTVLLALRFDFVDSLFEQDLELGLARQLLIVLLPGSLEQPTLMLHHLAKLFHDTVVAP